VEAGKDVLDQGWNRLRFDSRVIPALVLQTLQFGGHCFGIKPPPGAGFGEWHCASAAEVDLVSTKHSRGTWHSSGDFSNKALRQGHGLPPGQTLR